VKMSQQSDFIASIYGAAKKISEQTGMSAELMLAQAAQETGWGEKVLPGTNNLFNIKADSSWKGETATFSVPEYVNGQYITVNAKFRVYDSYDQALADRVSFLQFNQRYSNLFMDKVLGNFEAEV